ncbi:hypothetical protein KJ059_06385 [Myxococcota bacterium]|nr:hypothetical protein [Myxococcota bacterium]MCZ7618174.1 hypothetical protein [Myxococcota bacterium]
MSARLETIDARNWESFVAAPAAVLMLGKSDCEACRAWTEELSTWLDEDQTFRHVRFGKLLLDSPGLVSFKRANPWISELDALPFNLVYVGGERVKQFAGSGVERLVSRLERTVGEPPAAGGS